MSKGKYLAKTAGGTQPQNFGSNVVIGGGGTGQGGGPAGMTFGEAASVKDDKGISIIMSQQQAQDAQDAQQLSNYENQINQQFQDKLKKEKEEEERRKKLEASIPKTGIFGLDQDKLKFPLFLEFGKAAFEGFDSTNRFFKALAEKGAKGLSTKDKIILANLIGVGGLDTIDLNKYTTEDVNFEQLKDSFEEAKSDLEAGVNIGGPNAGKIVSYEDLINNYLSGEPKKGESFSAMYEDLKDLAFDPLRKTPNLVRDDGSYTAEGLKNVLGKEGIAYLHANRPDLYLSAFGLPQTGAGLERFANMSLIPGDKETNAMIIEARERAARDRQAQDKASGIMGASSSPAFASPTSPTSPTSQYGIFIGKPGPFIANFVDSDGDGVDDRFQSGPGQPSSQPLTLTDMKKDPVPMGTGITPFNINQFYASLPQYTQQGIMNPNLAQFYQNLQAFPKVV